MMKWIVIFVILGLVSLLLAPIAIAAGRYCAKQFMGVWKDQVTDEVNDRLVSIDREKGSK